MYETVLMDFLHIDGDHSGENLCAHFIKYLTFYEIPLSKILAITTDNIESNSTFMDAMEEHGIKVGVDVRPDEHRVRCMAHILNLCVQDIMKALNIPLNDESGCEDIDDPDEEVILGE